MPLQNFKTDHFLGELIKYTLCVGEKDLIGVILHRHVLWVLRRHVSIEFPFSNQ